MHYSIMFFSIFHLLTFPSFPALDLLIPIFLCHHLLFYPPILHILNPRPVAQYAFGGGPLEEAGSGDREKQTGKGKRRGEEMVV